MSYSSIFIIFIVKIQDVMKPANTCLSIYCAWETFQIVDNYKKVSADNLRTPHLYRYLSSRKLKDYCPDITD
jgi:hypothetical protein